MWFDKKNEIKNVSLFTFQFLTTLVAWFWREDDGTEPLLFDIHDVLKLRYTHRQFKLRLHLYKPKRTWWTLISVNTACFGWFVCYFFNIMFITPIHYMHVRYFYKYQVQKIILKTNYCNVWCYFEYCVSPSILNK